MAKGHEANKIRKIPYIFSRFQPMNEPTVLQTVVVQFYGTMEKGKIHAKKEKIAPRIIDKETFQLWTVCRWRYTRIIDRCQAVRKQVLGLRVVTGSKRRNIGLGGDPEVTLAMAREKAPGIKERVPRGIDPAIQRQAESLRLEAMTFSETVELCKAKKIRVSIIWTTIPASRTKAKREHRVPLSRDVLKLLESLMVMRPLRDGFFKRVPARGKDFPAVCGLWYPAHDGWWMPVCGKYAG